MMHRRQLPLAFACSRNLDDMPTRAGGRERWCDSCEQRVHDLSQLSEVEALELLRRRGAEGLCIAFAIDEREQVVFRRSRLDRIGVALASLALLLSSGCSGLVQLDLAALTVDPGCASVQRRNMTPVDQASRFELPEREADRDVITWMGEMDDVDGFVLLPKNVGYRISLGGHQALIDDIDPLHEIIALSERAP